MSLLDARIAALTKRPACDYTVRVLAQMEYARLLSSMEADALDAPIAAAADALESAYNAQGAVTKEQAMAAEKLLLPLSEKAKKYGITLVGHAHIDMNWMWRYDETVSITIETFRTVLQLMRESPDFTFAQSQASVYRIIEEYAPEMLPEIRQRVKEGRWEVAAATWVEADRNMPSSESVARHLLYTKQYLSKLLDIAPETLNLDYEPDTFGHSAYIPDMLSRGGVSYYYHCRGDDGVHIYRWKAPSGREVLCYREPDWYLGGIEYNMAMYAPRFCEQYGLTELLKVYGVGDHGGGPTRRDIARAKEMMDWPVYPRVKFGTYAEYFAMLDGKRSQFVEIDSELNAVFTGCYTTQTRIKRANRLGETALGEAEAFSAFAANEAGFNYRGEQLQLSWRKILFSQFHDIITGSCVRDTREYAMGQFQEVYAEANTQRVAAMRALAAKADTSALASECVPADRAMGAGVGYSVEQTGISRTEAGGGLTRIFHVFNSLPTQRTEVTELTVWDWEGDPARLRVRDSKGNVLPSQVLKAQRHNYWQHDFINVLVKIAVPACGYATIVLDENPEAKIFDPTRSDPRVHTQPRYVLENDIVSVEFDRETGAIESFIEKATGRDVSGAAQSPFRFIQEDPQLGMTSWYVGRYQKIELVDQPRISNVQKGALRHSVLMTAEFGRSSLTATYYLDDGCPLLKCDLSIEWREQGDMSTTLPQLQFALPLPCTADAAMYDVPGGVLSRKSQALDLPAQTLAAVPLPEGGALALIADAKHGFRCDGGLLSVTLTRASVNPDPAPDYGQHSVSLAMGPIGETALCLMRAAQRFTHPLSYVTGTGHKGENPADMSLVELVEGSAVISAVKLAEQGADIIVRGHDVGAGEKITLHFARTPSAAVMCDILENPVNGSVSVGGNTVTFTPEKHGMFSIRVTL